MSTTTTTTTTTVMMSMMTLAVTPATAATTEMTDASKQVSKQTHTHTTWSVDNERVKLCGSEIRTDIAASPSLSALLVLSS